MKLSTIIKLMKIKNLTLELLKRFGFIIKVFVTSSLSYLWLWITIYIYNLQNPLSTFLVSQTIFKLIYIGLIIFNYHRYKYIIQWNDQNQL